MDGRSSRSAFRHLVSPSSPFSIHVLSDVSLGIIYSDIGTSPLYVLNGIWPASGPLPSEEDIIGGISAIVWSLTLLPLLKYVQKPHFSPWHLLSLQLRSSSLCTSELKKVLVITQLLPFAC